MINFTLFVNFPLGGGVGFNTNILETNIINLSVVIAIVIFFVGDALRSLLDNRKQTVLKNFREANQRALQAQEKFVQAQNKLEFSKKKAVEICQQGITTAEQEKLQTIQQAEKEVIRLEELKKETITLQQQKVISQISHQIVALALKRVREKLENSLTDAFHLSVTNLNIVLFTNYKPK